MFRKDEKIWARGKLWRVGSTSELREQCLLLKLDPEHIGGKPINVVYPRESIVQATPAALRFDKKGFVPYELWKRNHQFLALGAVRAQDPLAGLCYGRVSLEAYQLAPILRMLVKPRPRLLIADDVGLGKTIEAGLCMLALLARKWTDRILVVVPPGLLDQWDDELKNRFNLSFERIDNASGLAKAQTRLHARVNPWDILPRILTSTEYLKKREIMTRALRNPWDLIIVDEAHYLSEAGTSKNPYKTKRTRLGEAIRDKSEGLILLTATPHNGYSNSLRSLIELVEPTAATFKGDVNVTRARIEQAMIRRMKSQITINKDGKRSLKFHKRNVDGIKVSLAGLPIASLFSKVSNFCSKIAKDSQGREDEDLISFAMQIIKKRMLSSRKALEETIKERLKALKEKGHVEEAPERVEIKELQTDLPLGDFQRERITRRIIRSAIPKEERLRRSETRKLEEISKLLKRIPAGDPKLEALVSFLKDFLKDPSEKVIVFTEYLDTLQAIEDRLFKEDALRDRLVVLKGGFSPKKRTKICNRFESKEIRILLATDAASEGLNLHHKCRCVVHNELPWNPNRLEQRNGRVDRYGQERKPEIRYLYYPDTPEDDVLHRLVNKIETMQSDLVSTPDTLGIISGLDIETSLTHLEPGEPGYKEGVTLIKNFEDHTNEFVKDCGVILGSTAEKTLTELQHGENILLTGDPVLEDDLGIEKFLKSRLGKALKEVKDGVYAVQVPRELQAAEVRPQYCLVTCRRSVALLPENSDVEFLTPLHPLVKAIINESQKKLLFPAVGRNNQGERLACRRSSLVTEPGILFSLWGCIEGSLSLGRPIVIEEQILPVFVRFGGEISKDRISDERIFSDSIIPGEVPQSRIEFDLGDRFTILLEAARKEADRRFKAFADQIASRRAEMARLMRDDLASYITSRLRELAAEEENRKRIGGDADLPLIIEERFKDIETKRAQVNFFKSEREKEITAFEYISTDRPVQAIGALVVYPGEEKKSRHGT